MKKLLKILLTLAGTTTLPVFVVGCRQEALDSNLNIIYKGLTKYNIEELGIKKDTSEKIKEYTLSINDVEIVAKTIAHLNLKTAGIEVPLNWYSEKENFKSDKKYYKFEIKNGKKSEDGNNLTWRINQVNARFTVKISYLVGIISSDGSFVAQQKIDMLYDIKCATSKSEELLEGWINEFNEKKWSKDNPIIVNLPKDIEIPKSGISWSDLNSKIKEIVNLAISKEIAKFTIRNVSILIENSESNIEDNKLGLKISASLGDEVRKTDLFYIKFA